MWICKAPSNIALIKYMGKLENNIPCNVSLSYTLKKFQTEVSLKICDKRDIFADEMHLGSEAAARFLHHLARIKKITACHEFFEIKSKNNFPHSAGIASSASSFAALTICAFKAICEIKNLPMPSLEEMSQISREASGSSCRSFFSPWCRWEGKSTEKIDIKINNLSHDLVLVSKKSKEISSGNAHRLVKSSLLFEGRPKRASLRFEKLVDALNSDKWSDAYQLCWEEFWDMHALFETSNPHFGYINSATIAILSQIREYWKNYNDGPIVTIDAGSNVHLLWRLDQITLRNKLKSVLDQNNIEFSFYYPNNIADSQTISNQF
jgi:diphosphomevalonate decarboxylase